MPTSNNKATRNKGIATSNRGITTSSILTTNNKRTLLGTRASLLGARSYVRGSWQRSWQSFSFLCLDSQRSKPTSRSRTTVRRHLSELRNDGAATFDGTPTDHRAICLVSLVHVVSLVDAQEVEHVKKGIQMFKSSNILPYIRKDSPLRLFEFSPTNIFTSLNPMVDLPLPYRFSGKSSHVDPPTRKTRNIVRHCRSWVWESVTDQFS